MKLITEGWPKGDEILMDEVQVKYLQSADNCSSEDDVQELTLITKDGGGGKYINFKTNEYGWSISDEEDLIQIFKHFKNIYENSNNS